MAKAEPGSKTAAKPKTAKKKVTKKKVAPKKTAPKKAVKKKSSNKKAASKTPSRVKSPKISVEQKRMMIAVHAYYKWQNAGCPNDCDTQYWLEAEQEIEGMLG